MIEPLRQSVLTGELERYYFCGWAYVMPNFDTPDHSIVEWLSPKMPVYPANRVPETTKRESANGSDHRSQQRS